MTPLVSVLIPCFNEAPFIEACLDSVLASDYPRLEVIVADGASEDGTRAVVEKIAARDGRLRLIDNPGRITPAALNLATAASQGEILIRFDGHAAMPPDYIARLVALLASSGADNVGGSIRTVTRSRGLFAGPIAAALASRFGVGNSQFRTSLGEKGARPADTVFGGCWRRELFTRIGGFNEQLPRGQDLEWNLRLRRAGGTILLDPEIVCDYYARTGLASFWRHNFRNGEWAIVPFARSEVVPVRARHLIPFAFVIALAGSLAAPLPWSAAVACAYLAANLAASAHAAASHRRIDYLALMPVAFASLHLAYGLGSAWGCWKLAARKLRASIGAGTLNASRLKT